MVYLIRIGQLKQHAGDYLTLIVILLVCVALEALILSFLLRRRKCLRIVAGALSFAFALTAFSLSAPDKAPQPAEPAESEFPTEGDPRDTAEAFLTAIQRADDSAACACLSGYRTLGLEDVPEGETARLMAEALRESFSFLLRGPAVVDGWDARQSVSLTVLDLSAMAPDLRQEAELYLKTLSEELPRSKIADEEGRFLPAVADEAYRIAMQNTLAHRGDYLLTLELELHLRYTSEGWLVLPDPALLEALGGLIPPAEGGNEA